MIDRDKDRQSTGGRSTDERGLPMDSQLTIDLARIVQAEKLDRVAGRHHTPRGRRSLRARLRVRRGTRA
jgi:hypothetical protein